LSDIDPELSRAYREASSAEPPAALDAAILAAARAQAAQPRSRDRRQARSFWRNWMAPASAVATLVLGLSIALMIEHEQPGTADESPVRALPQPAGPLPGRAEEAAKAAADSAAASSPEKKDAPAMQAYPAERRAKAAAPVMGAPQAEIESKAAGRSAPLREQSLTRSPEAWLAEIERLKRDGRGEEAAQQLAQFRNAYPGYAVPEALLK
jgi:hypothetical protein